MQLHNWTVKETGIDGCLEILGRHTADDRGSFTETFVLNKIPGFSCSQSNVVWSLPKDGMPIVRGIHVSPYKKLITCPVGLVFDLCIDLRPGSPTEGQWHISTLHDTKMLLIPERCGHAYMTSNSNKSLVIYYQSDVWQPDREVVVNVFDSDLRIEWPVRSDRGYIMSEKDKIAPTWKQADFSCLIG